VAKFAKVEVFEEVATKLVGLAKLGTILPPQNAELTTTSGEVIIRAVDGDMVGGEMACVPLANIGLVHLSETEDRLDRLGLLVTDPTTTTTVCYILAVTKEVGPQLWSKLQLLTGKTLPAEDESSAKIPAVEIAAAEATEQLDVGVDDFKKETAGVEANGAAAAKAIETEAATEAAAAEAATTAAVADSAKERVSLEGNTRAAADVKQTAEAACRLETENEAATAAAVVAAKVATGGETRPSADIEAKVAEAKVVAKARLDTDAAAVTTASAAKAAAAPERASRMETDANAAIAAAEAAAVSATVEHAALVKAEADVATAVASAEAVQRADTMQRADTEEVEVELAVAKSNAKAHADAHVNANTQAPAISALSPPPTVRAPSLPSPPTTTAHSLPPPPTGTAPSLPPLTLLPLLPSSLAPSLPGPALAIAPICKACEEEKTTTFCGDCKGIQFFCSECFGFTHRKGSKKTHCAIPVELYVCKVCEEEVTTKYCGQCRGSQFFCDECFQFSHRKQSKASHAAVPLQLYIGALGATESEREWRCVALCTVCVGGHSGCRCDHFPMPGTVARFFLLISVHVWLWK
jgi:hypothetical protein